MGRSVGSAKQQRESQFGTHLTRATIARGLAIAEKNDGNAVPERRHSVAASRLVEAGLSFGLFELEEAPDKKQKPILGTKRLSQFMHALGDYAYWSMKAAVDNSKENPARKGMSDGASRFEPEEARETRDKSVDWNDSFLVWLNEDFG